MSDYFVYQDGSGLAIRQPGSTEADSSYALREWSCCEGNLDPPSPWRSIYASGLVTYTPPLGGIFSLWGSPRWVWSWTNPSDPTQKCRFEFYYSLLYNVSLNATEFTLSYFGYAYNGVTSWVFGDNVAEPVFAVVSPGYTPEFQNVTISLENDVLNPKMEVSVNFQGGDLATPRQYAWEFTGLRSALQNPPGWAWMLPTPTAQGFFYTGTPDWTDSLSYWEGSCENVVDEWPTQIALP